MVKEISQKTNKQTLWLLSHGVMELPFHCDWNMESQFYFRRWGGPSHLGSILPVKFHALSVLTSLRTSVLDYGQLRPSLCFLVFLNLSHKILILPQNFVSLLFSILNLYVLLFLSIPIQVIRNSCILELKLLCLLINFSKGCP